jgi:hypothetical protein
MATFDINSACYTCTLERGRVVWTLRMHFPLASEQHREVRAAFRRVVDGLSTPLEIDEHAEWSWDAWATRTGIALYPADGWVLRNGWWYTVVGNEIEDGVQEALMPVWQALSENFNLPCVDDDEFQAVVERWNKYTSRIEQEADAGDMD